jgi:hypothetical protein
MFQVWTFGIFYFYPKSYRANDTARFSRITVTLI